MNPFKSGPVSAQGQSGIAKLTKYVDDMISRPGRAVKAGFGLHDKYSNVKGGHQERLGQIVILREKPYDSAVDVAEGPEIESAAARHRFKKEIPLAAFL